MGVHFSLPRFVLQELVKNAMLATVEQRDRRGGAPEAWLALARSFVVRTGFAGQLAGRGPPPP